ARCAARLARALARHARRALAVAQATSAGDPALRPTGHFGARERPPHAVRVRQSAADEARESSARACRATSCRAPRRRDNAMEHIHVAPRERVAIELARYVRAPT